MRTLSELDSELEREFQGVTLLGQLDYDRSDLAFLREALRPQFRHAAANGRDTFNWGDRYLRPLAMYLVLEATYSYETGDYWTSVRQALGIDTTYQSYVGDLFRRVLHEHRLPTFEHLKGHVNVTPILAHAGIPNYCLDDYFKLLLRAMKEHGAVDAATLLDEWRRDGFAIAIDMPVQRFLLYGGPIAQDFVSRSLELWHAAGNELDLIGLPDRVIERFQAWRSAHHGYHAPKPQRSHLNLSPPRLMFDPYGEGIALILPTVTLDTSAQSVRWYIEGNRQTQTIETVWRRSQDGYQFSPTELPNVPAAATYQVQLMVDDKLRKTWVVAGIGDPPFLVFDPETNELLPDQSPPESNSYLFSPGERYVVYPRTWTVVAGTAQQSVDLPDQEGDWADFRFESWSFSANSKLSMLGPNKQDATIAAHSDAPLKRPMLTGNPILPATKEREYAVYAGRPPLLVMPAIGRAVDPSRWRIILQSDEQARPAIELNRQLHELREHLVHDSEQIILDLSAPELLGESPIGSFSLRLKGPFGQSAAFAMRFVPGLRLDKYPQLLVNEADPAAARIICDNELSVRAEQPGSTLTIYPPRRLYQNVTAWTVKAPSDATSFDLRFDREDGSSVTISLPIHRLRWGLMAPSTADSFRWGSRLLRIHPQALADLHSAEVKVDLPLWPDAPIRARAWQLVSVDGTVLLNQTRSEGRSSRYFRTLLPEWLDTFQASEMSACLQLVISAGSGDSGDDLTVDLVTLVPTLELDHVLTGWEQNGEYVVLTFVLDPDPVARGRELRLWPTDRPWARPLQLSIPDDTDGSFEISVPSVALVAGEYIAEIAVADPWVDLTHEPPDDEQPNRFQLRPDDFEQVLGRELSLAADMQSEPERALALLHYFARKQRSEQLQEANRAIWLMRERLTADQLLAWADTVRDADPNAYKQAQMALGSAFSHALFVDDEVPEHMQQAWLRHVLDRLPAETCHRLLPVVGRASRLEVLNRLCQLSDQAAFAKVLNDYAAARITHETAVWLLSQSSVSAVEFLLGQGEGPAEQLVDELLRKDGQTLKRSKIWIYRNAEIITNAGPGIVLNIVDKFTGKPKSLCSINRGPFLIEVRFAHRSNYPIAATIDLDARVIDLSEVVYKCPDCEFARSEWEPVRKHFFDTHRLAPMPYIRKNYNQVALTTILKLVN